MSEGRSRKDMERGEKNMLKNEGSCNDGKVVLSKRYKASDMESGKDTSVLESRTVRARSNKCNRLKRAKGSGSRRWEYSSLVRGKLDSSANSHLDTEDLEAEKQDRGIDESISLEYFDGDVRSDLSEGVKSTVERIKSFLDKVAEEETELELVLGELGLSRKKKVKSRSKKVAKAKSTRSMTGVDEGTRQTSGEEIKKALPTSGTAVSGEVEQGKRRRVEPLGGSGEKVIEVRSASVDDLKEVEKRVRLAILQGKENTSQMLKAAHAMAIGQLQVEAKPNLDETAEEHDRLGYHLMLTYAEEEEKETEVLEVVDGLDGVSPQTVLDNQRDDVELQEGGSEKAEFDASRVREDHVLMCNREFAKQFDRMKEANENWEDQYVGALAMKGKQADMAQYHIQALERTKELCRSDLNSCRIELERMRDKFIGKDDEYDGLNERVARLKAERDQAIARAKKAEARKHSGGSRTMIKAPLVQGDVVSLSGCIRELESDVSQIQGHVQRGNADLRECQHKLDAALIREKVLEGEIKAKELLVKRKDKLLKDLVDADRNVWKDTYASVKVRHERLKARFAKVVAPDVSRSTLLSVIVAYFVEEVKRLESEHDTLLKTLSDKGCTCGAKIDRGNCLGVMETQLGPRTVEFLERGRAVVVRELTDRPLNDVGESIVDTPPAEKNLL
ncbi:hypothetical protein GIB67_034181 [Kingdonia uniflora]|uniref:Uncharacterized protein n=1 Tax=Kingdonia uniflora TaxID=39325 RepID=A0A7J7NRJ5_9MAGN|nr:hypothetical protein GIB67_034181 [Kingdonia uniflora]